MGELSPQNERVEPVKKGFNLILLLLDSESTVSTTVDRVIRIWWFIRIIDARSCADCSSSPSSIIQQVYYINLEITIIKYLLVLTQTIYLGVLNQQQLQLLLRLLQHRLTRARKATPTFLVSLHNLRPTSLISFNRIMWLTWITCLEIFSSLHNNINHSNNQIRRLVR